MGSMPRAPKPPFVLFERCVGHRGRYSPDHEDVRPHFGDQFGIGVVLSGAQRPDLSDGRRADFELAHPPKPIQQPRFCSATLECRRDLERSCLSRDRRAPQMELPRSVRSDRRRPHGRSRREARQPRDHSAAKTRHLLRSADLDTPNRDEPRIGRAACAPRTEAADRS